MNSKHGPKVICILKINSLFSIRIIAQIFKNNCTRQFFVIRIFLISLDTDIMEGRFPHIEILPFEAGEIKTEDREFGADATGPRAEGGKFRGKPDFRKSNFICNNS